jgi:hypothetical protein
MLHVCYQNLFNAKQLGINMMLFLKVVGLVETGLQKIPVGRID